VSTLRADAQRNLGRVLDAAAEVLAEQGPDASIDEIARRAGVGHGTVFRRFPTKESLLAAVMCLRLEQFSAWADESLAEPDAGAAFESFVWRIAESFARDRALCEGLPRCGETAQLLEAKQRLHDLIGALVTRAQDQGSLRRDITPDDVPILVGSAILGSNQMDAGDAWRRYVGVVLDGMRAPGAAR
jgi:AcrR family transcriptional regulator